jgi:hypothetical protein
MCQLLDGHLQVRWLVLKRPVYLSLDQLATIAAVVGEGGVNARPTQNRFWLNGYAEVRTLET